MKNLYKNTEIVKSSIASPIQQGLYYECLSSLNEVPCYVAQMIISVNVEINFHYFQRATQQVLSHYGELRASFEYKSSLLRKVIHSSVDVPMEFIDLSCQEENEKYKNYEFILKSDSLKGFELDVPPLMRLVIIHYANQNSRIIWSRHHMIMDGSSAINILNEIFQSYFYLIEHGKTMFLKKVQNEEDYPGKVFLSKTREKKYWRSLLENHENFCQIPTMIKRVKSFHKDTLSLCLDRDVYRRMSLLIEKQGLSFNSVLLSIWGIALAHYGNNEEVILGSVRGLYPYTQRSPIGLHINTLPVVLRLSKFNSVLEYLLESRNQLQNLKEHFFTSLLDIKKWCNIPADSMVFDSIVDYKPVSNEKILNEQLREINFDVTLNLQTPHALVLEVINFDEYLNIKVSYDTGLYDRAYICQIITHYLSLIEIISKRPWLKVRELPTLTESEYQKVVIDFNNSDKLHFLTKNIPACFEECVEKNLKKVAVFHNDQPITYEELNRKVNQLSNFLIKNGLKVEDVVGILQDSSIQAIISILAVLKSGGAYLPLDAEHPLERNKYFLSNSNAKWVITSSNMMGNPILSGANQFNIINVNDEEINFLEDQNPNRVINSKNLAYVIYTSGTTGKPKGVMIEHSSVVNLCEAQKKLFGLSQASRVLQFSSLVFDASVWEIFPTLLSGGGIFIPGKDVKFDTGKLVQFIEENKITVATFPPSYFEAIKDNNFTTLNSLIMAGEPALDISAYFNSSIQYYNAYGPTEATVCSSIKLLRKNELITIGSPLQNSKIYILNKNQQPVPISVSGEVYISGAGVARGFIGDDERTKRFFYQNPFSDNPDERMYRTGDMARWLKDGEIEFIGREDSLIKISGFRISTNEIENSLLMKSNISEAVVLGCGQSKITEIIAFIKESSPITEQEIREFLSGQLPYYMIPHHILKIDSVPLTSNGKIDRNKLMSFYHAYESKDFGDESYSPDDKILTGLIELVKNITGREFCATNKNLFELGMRSLELIRLSRMIKDKFDVSIKITDLFIYTTVELLREYISSLKGVSQVNNKISKTTKSRLVVFRHE